MSRVQTSQGVLEGTSEVTSSGFSYSSFKGIPYATPPLGDLRFSYPRPPQKWEGVRSAKEHGGVCPQNDLLRNEIIEGSEDCLYLNVYTPKLLGLAPVMVWIHGGAFSSGSGDSIMYGPDYFVEEGVVLVTINYRLEVLGFLCLHNDEVPGNAGMKDQAMALKWVQENISKFGGDPKNVTIFGESAGGASVTFHLLSPMSKGLFHKAIAQSGSCLNEWTVARKSIERAFRIGKYFKKDAKDANELLTFLKSLEAKKLVNLTYAVSTKAERDRTLALFFSPVVEKVFEGQECFLPKSPEEYLKEGNLCDVPILMGYNDSEGMFFANQILRTADYIQNNFEVKVPLDIADTVSPDQLKIFGEQLRNFYLGDKKISEETLNEMTKLEGDYNFNYGVQKFARTVSGINKNPVFLYNFTAESELNFIKSVTGFSDIKGARHADDLFYMFKTFQEVKEDSKEMLAIRRVVRMWTNFAKFSNPTPGSDPLITTKWKPITQNEPNYLDIGLELKPGVNLDKERFEFWETLYRQARGKPQSRL